MKLQQSNTIIESSDLAIRIVLEENQQFTLFTLDNRKSATVTSWST
jgi:hypothetical protein